jgi:hypothetical protein
MTTESSSSFVITERTVMPFVVSRSCPRSGSVDGAYDRCNCRALLTESRCCVEHGAARGDHVFDEKHVASNRIGTLCKPQGAVRLGFLSDEQRRDAGEIAQDRHHRDSTKFETTKHVGAGRDERDHAIDDSAQQDRVGLEQILVEVLVRHCTRP